MVLSTGVAKRTSFGQVGPQPIETQVSSILTNGYSLKNVVFENWNRFAEIAREVVHSATSLKIHLGSKGPFLALNLTGINATVIRYSIWLTATTIQLMFIPEQIQTKLPVIVGSLMRNCHFQFLDLVVNPCIGYIFRF